MTIEALIENVYNDSPLTETASDHIYDLSMLRLENGVKEFSRYNLPLLESTFDPYRITNNLIKKLHRKIIVVHNAPIEAYSIEDNIICSSPEKVIVNEFPKKLVTKPLITDSGEFTPLGIFGILFGRCYGDLYFKARVEDSLAKIGYKPAKFGSKDVLLYEKASRFNIITNITKFDDYNRNGELFFWKD